jgi:hypothetical protein
MVNFLALLGWNDGTEQEIFSVSEHLRVIVELHYLSGPSSAVVNGCNIYFANVADVNYTWSTFCTFIVMEHLLYLHSHGTPVVPS